MGLPETSKTHQRRIDSGFFRRYMNGQGVDVGYRGNGITNPQPVILTAAGIDLGTPGYDGINLPQDELDFVFSSHMLEHVPTTKVTPTLQAWHKALRIGGHMVIVVPHQFLYEKRRSLPSKWNGDHKRFYTPASLLAEVEAALAPNTYRVRHLQDNDDGYTYGVGPQAHAGGCYEIELVVQKIQAPGWDLC